MIEKPMRLEAGDRVRFVSPASPPSREHVEKHAAYLEGLGLRVEIGDHAFARLGHLAGTDEQRLSDFNNALRDPGLKAIVATRGGKGAYRIARGLDFDAAKENPKLVIGFSEITILHLALAKHCGLAGLHGAAWPGEFDQRASASFERAAFTDESIEISHDKSEETCVLTTSGRARGRLVGGNQDMIATAAGWVLPNLDGAILLLEAVTMRIGHIDRQLTMLIEAGHLNGVVGVAVGQYADCGSKTPKPGHIPVMDVIADRLRILNVPVLGGLPIGHGPRPVAVPLGTVAELDANAGALTIESAVR